MRKLEVTNEQYELITLALENLFYRLKDEDNAEKMEAVTELELSLSKKQLEYRAVLHNPNNGNNVVESMWVDNRAEAERIGTTGLGFYGGTHYTIEEQ